MKWNKYPETKPASGSDKAAVKCLLWIEIPPYSDPLKKMENPSYHKMLGYYHMGQWTSDSGIFSDNFPVRYYMYLDDIPAPEEKNEVE